MTNLDKRGLQDDHGPSDIDQRAPNHGNIQDVRGQEEPTDRNPAQQEQQSQMEGPAAYAPHDKSEKPTPKYSDM
jgi:hypothetical protein